MQRPSFTAPESHPSVEQNPYAPCFTHSPRTVRTWLQPSVEQLSVSFLAERPPSFVSSDLAFSSMQLCLAAFGKKPHRPYLCRAIEYTCLQDAHDGTVNAYHLLNENNPTGISKCLYDNHSLARSPTYTQAAVLYCDASRTTRSFCVVPSIEWGPWSRAILHIV